MFLVKCESEVVVNVYVWFLDGNMNGESRNNYVDEWECEWVVAIIRCL